MATNPRPRRDHRVANLRVSKPRQKSVLDPYALELMSARLNVPPEVAEEMFERLVGSDYRRWEAQALRCGHCARPIRLQGRVVDGDGVERFNTADEPDGVLLKRCGNRRRSQCPSCSFQYAGDMWHLLYAGLAGDSKGVPATVASHPMALVTLTAPSFGPVHSTRARDGRPQRCRPRRDGRSCPHGRPVSCMSIHDDGDPTLGTPLCGDCYDYTQAVLFNWWSPELWRRFTVDLYRSLASSLGSSEAKLRRLVRISYAKVAEPQQRGVVHFHAIVRIDATGEGWHQPPTGVSVGSLIDAVEQAARRARLTAQSHHGELVSVRFGDQTDVQPIHQNANLLTGELNPQKVAAYISKYACKAPDDFGVSSRAIDAATAEALGLSDHAIRMIQAASDLSTLPGYERLAAWTHSFGFRGHFSTHSRNYSTSLTALRTARFEHAREGAADPTSRQELIAEWRFAGVGYTTAGDAALAAKAEASARELRPYIREAARQEGRGPNDGQAPIDAD